MDLFKNLPSPFRDVVQPAGLPSRKGLHAPAIFDVVASALTDPGLVRAGNEDAVSFTRPADPRLVMTHGVLAIVADGMGGCDGGEIASDLACRSIEKAYFDSKLHVKAGLNQAFEFANHQIFETAVKNPELRGMGTTCVALAIVADRAYMAYVGDSRLYLMREGHIYRMTEDHTVVNELANQGLLSREQARLHPDRNVLSRALGSKVEVLISVWEEPVTVEAGDRFLLCSDGLHDVISDDELRTLLESSDLKDVCALLISKGNEYGGPDNISVVVVEVRERSRQIRPPALTREVEMP